MAGGPARTPAQRFAERCAPPDANGCTLWTGGRTSKKDTAYGLFFDGERMVPAHRWALEQKTGPLGKLDACHECDVRLCVTLGHLFPGTRKQNMEDAVRKGRTSHVARNVGEKHPMARLQATDVVAIRDWHHAGWAMRDLSLSFGVTFAQVSRIIHRQSWKHIQ